MLVASNVPASLVESPSTRSKAVEIFAGSATGLVFVFAALALAEQLVGARFFTRLLPGPPLEPSTALSFALLSVAIFLAASGDGQRRLAGRLAGLVVGIFGAIEATEHLFGVDLGIDRLLGSRSAPGMGAANAVELVLLGVGTAAIDVKVSSDRRPSDFLAFAALFLIVRAALASLFGAAGAESAVVGVSAPLSLALAAGALLAAPGRSGILSLFLSESAPGVLARQLLPVAVAAPLFAGLVVVLGLHRGFLDAGGAVALLVTLAMAAFTAIVWLGASGISRADAAAELADELQGQVARADRAREQAEASCAHYLQLLRGLDVIVWEADLESERLAFASPGVRELLGESPERLISSGDLWPRLVHPWDRERVMGELAAAEKERRDCSFEFRTIVTDGRLRWFTSRLYAAQGDGSRPWRRGVMIDVTERKLHEQRLEAQYEATKVLAESQTLPAALPRLLSVLGSTIGWDCGSVWTLDRDAGVLRCVETWQRSPSVGSAFVAKTRERSFARGEEFPGRVWAAGGPLWLSDVASDEGFTRVSEADPLLAAVGAPIRARDEFLGVLELFSAEALSVDEGLLALVASVGGQLGQFIDQRRGDERRREESAALEIVSRLTPMASGALEVDRLVQELTDAATKLANARFGTFYYYGRDGGGDGYRTYTSGATSRDAFGLPASRSARFPIRLFSSDGPLRVDDARRGSLPGGLQLPSNGTTIASYLAVPVVSRTGRILGGLALAHPEPGVFTKREERVVTGIAAHAAVAIDNAELYEAERRAREAAEAASRAKDEFLAMLGHELRNPIGAIRNSVEALEISQARNGDGAGEMLCSIIGRQTETLAQLVDDLLDVTRLISGKIRLRTRLVDLMELTSQTLESLRAAGRASRHFVHFAGEPVFVEADPVRLEQIVTNLVENALKYTPEGGEVEVAVERHSEAVAQLRVRDNGQGIEPDLLPRIFDLFVQGKQSLDRPRGGLGIGLTLVRRLAELHGGMIEAESAGAGQGSEFRVRLPAHSFNQRAAAESAPELAKVTPRHVLIVEDHADSRESLRLLLEASGHRVDVAGNGNEAVDLALSRPPEIAFVDIGLPGLDGYDVAREIRAAEGTDFVYLVALTGYGQPLDRRRALESGFNEHMVKPLRREKLLRLMASLDAPERRPDE